jgi:hypothetical protein
VRSAATSASGTGGGASVAGEELQQQVVLHHPDGRLKTREELRKERKRFTNRASESALFSPTRAPPIGALSSEQSRFGYLQRLAPVIVMGL